MRRTAHLLVEVDGFEIVAGRALLAAFYTRAEATRQLVSVRSGTLDGAPGIRPSLHSWVASKAPWTEIGDGLRQFPRGLG